jgi:hypothetical protein
MVGVGREVTVIRIVVVSGLIGGAVLHAMPSAQLI